MFVSFIKCIVLHVFEFIPSHSCIASLAVLYTNLIAHSIINGRVGTFQFEL